MDLVEDHIWCSAGEMGAQNVNAPYVANMPTEEVFSDPDFRSVNGIAYASFPLFINGKLVLDDGKLDEEALKTTGRASRVF